MRRIFDEYAYGPEPDRGNFWRKTAPEPDGYGQLEGDTDTDFAVLGAGFTGLSAALTLAEAGESVTVLDAERPGWGASGRNGGFCCLGGAALSAAAMSRRYGPEETRTFLLAERAAVELVSDTLDRLKIDADRHSEGETLLAHKPERMAQLRKYADEARENWGVECAVIERQDLARHGMNSQEFHGAVTNPIGFALNPLKYVLGLAQAAQGRGARILVNSQVTEISRDPDGKFTLATARGRLRAKRLLIATNGYSSEDVPAWMAARYLPTQSNILVTRPMSEDEIAAQGWTSAQMSYDTRQHLHYFRLMPDRRMLFGVRGDVRSSPEMTAQTRARARADFERIFPAWKSVDTPDFWSGLLCLSRSLVPFAGPVPGMDGAFAAFAYHGNGVAMGSYAGRLLAELAMERTGQLPYPGFMQRPPGRFPLGRWRRLYLRAAFEWHKLSDQR